SEDLQLLPSPLLAGAELEPPAHRAPWLPASLHREGLTESLIDATGPPWTPAQPLPRGTRSLTLQNQCPFRAYAELRLGSTRRETVEPGIACTRSRVMPSSLSRGRACACASIASTPSPAAGARSSITRAGGA